MTEKHLTLILKYIFDVAKTNKNDIKIDYHQLLAYLDTKFPYDFTNAINTYFLQSDVNNVAIAEQLKDILVSSLNIPLFEGYTYIGTIQLVKKTGLITNAAIVQIIKILKSSDQELDEVKDVLLNLFGIYILPLNFVIVNSFYHFNP